jgi:quercetin dioxygenase-like cupin family protein
MSEWVVGRAGMLYRDLVPDRVGGRFIASHIRIPDDGPVPDWVHWHRVRFQTIYCYRGSVRVVYEDQGPPIVLEPGDCVLQPPGIRHRVLESTGRLEVIEVTSPSDHETLADETLALPTDHVRPDREWAGQRFVFHRAAQARWMPHHIAGFEARDTGIGDATSGLASVKVVRPRGPIDATLRTHDRDLLFLFVLDGRVTLLHGDDAQSFSREDAIVIPPDRPHALVHASPDLALLEISVAPSRP